VPPTADLVGNQALWEWSIYLWAMVAVIIGKSQREIMTLLFMSALMG
jgi:hypothetical protein